MKILTHDTIEQKIFLIRNHRVMLDKDLATLYGVPTKRLNEQVIRNVKRFPKDFMFKLTKKEAASLRSQNATLKRGKHSKYLPYAFTEQGVAMLSSVLNSERAIDVNIAIIRVFVKLRHILSTHKELSHKLDELERKIERHDSEIQSIFEAIHQLMTVPEEPKGKIGFHPN
jgi:phage regulator Rha-like protein